MHEQRSVCEFVTRLAALVFVNTRPIVDPGPLREQIERPDVRNPAKSLYRYADDLRARTDAGENPAELSRLSRRLTRSPEFIAALYQASPSLFVGLFGSAGFADVVGPGIDRVTPRALAAEDLTPQGLDALEQLRALVASLPQGEAQGAIGTFEQF
jgi:hypothetical protein